MNIQLRFFASTREKLGVTQEKVNLPEHVQTIGELRAYLRQRGGVWAEALAENCALRVAYNQEISDADARLVDACEVAFFPPVTGG